MKKYSFWTVSILLLTVTLPAMSWISVKGSKAQLAAEKYNNTTKQENLTAITYSSNELFDQYVSNIYNEAKLGTSGLDVAVFKKAVLGYYNFKKAALVSADNAVITIVDFNKSSRSKRLWIVNLDKKQLLFNTLVAHGQGSGDDMAQNFSNLENSHQSSLGFYITSDIYYGKHGESLKLNGMDKGYNSNANHRAVVVHGASYVSQDFINVHGRLGRSHGCPALPQELTAAIIQTIKGKTCLYINKSDSKYSSDYLNPSLIAELFPSSTSLQASL